MFVRKRVRVFLSLLVSASIVLASCSTEPSASPRPGASEVASATATPGAASDPPASTPAPAATPASTTGPWPASTILATWSRLDLPERVADVPGGHVPNDLVWFNDRVVAVGGVPSACCDAAFSTTPQALVWRSRDSISWNLLPESEAFDLGNMRAAAANDTLVVAVGVHLRSTAPVEGAQVGATWSSTDGRGWSMVWGSVPLFVDVVATNDGFVAATAGGRRPAPAIWHTVDGLTWTRVASPIELGNGVISRLIRTPDGYLAVGASVNEFSDEGSSETPRAAVWFSVDGLEWARVPDQAGFEDAMMTDVAVRDGRYLAVGYDREFGTRMWLSDDAQRWRRVDDPAVESGIQSARVFALSAAFVVTGGQAGSDNSDLLAWTTTDGSTWAVIPDQAAFDGINVTITATLEVEGGRVIAVGSYRGDARDIPAAWSIR